MFLKRWTMNRPSKFYKFKCLCYAAGRPVCLGCLHIQVTGSVVLVLIVGSLKSASGSVTFPFWQCLDQSL